jgi:hypothetical protein
VYAGLLVKCLVRKPNLHLQLRLHGVWNDLHQHQRMRSEHRQLRHAGDLYRHGWVVHLRLQFRLFGQRNDLQRYQRVRGDARHLRPNGIMFEHQRFIHLYL